MNFNSSEMETSVIKAYSASASGSSTELNVVWQTPIRMVLIKIYLIIRSYFLILKPRDASTYLKSWGSVFIRAKIQITK
jgi:hypothetical protein